MSVVWRNGRRRAAPRRCKYHRSRQRRRASRCELVKPSAGTKGGRPSEFLPAKSLRLGPDPAWGVRGSAGFFRSRHIDNLFRIALKAWRHLRIRASSLPADSNGKVLFWGAAAIIIIVGFIGGAGAPVSVPARARTRDAARSPFQCRAA